MTLLMIDDDAFDQDRFIRIEMGDVSRIGLSDINNTETFYCACSRANPYTISKIGFSAPDLN
jgi:hypothetical protein